MNILLAIAFMIIIIIASYLADRNTLQENIYYSLWYYFTLFCSCL